MIYQENNDGQEEAIKASYLLGTASSIQVKFDLKIPISPENYLTPIKTRIELLDSDLALLLPAIDSPVPNVPWSLLDTSAIDRFGFVYFQTTFAVNGSIGDASLLEKYLKKCKTTYAIKGGEDGIREFLIYDSVHISSNKHHLVMRKYITLNREP